MAATTNPRLNYSTGLVVVAQYSYVSNKWSRESAMVATSDLGGSVI